MDNKTLEATLAKMLERVEGLPDVLAQAKAAQEAAAAAKAEAEDLRKSNTKQAEQLDQFAAKLETMGNRIAVAPRIVHEGRRAAVNRHGVPELLEGLREANEERPADERFSLLRAWKGVRTQNFADAKWEKEVMDRAAKAYTKTNNQVIGDDNRGGFFVPDQVLGDVIPAIYRRSAFMALDGEGETNVTVLDGLVGGNVRLPRFLGGTIAYMIGEEQDFTKSFAQVGFMGMSPKKMGVLVGITHEMEQFGGYGFETLLRRDIIKSAAVKLDQQIAFGTGGDHQCLGIARHNIRFYDAAALGQVGAVKANRAAAEAHTWTASGVGINGFDLLEEMGGVLEDDDIMLDDRSATVSSPRFYRWLKQLKVENYSAQSSGQPFLLGVPISNARLSEMIGRYTKGTVIDNDHLAGESIGFPNASSPAQDGCTTVFKGDLSEVIVGRWGGIEISDDRGLGLGMVNDVTLMKLRLYVDVGVRQPRAVICAPNVQVWA